MFNKIMSRIQRMFGKKKGTNNSNNNSNKPRPMQDSKREIVLLPFFRRSIEIQGTRS
jgi:hypothetical protein